MINEAGLSIIKAFEGFRAEPYLCPANVWTIGYGTTRYPDGHAVAEHDAAVTEEEAEALLAAHVKRISAVVAGLTPVPLAENQISAVISLAYNIGTGAYRASTLRSKLLRREYESASLEFPRWCRAGGRVLPGLLRRRQAEKELYDA